MDDDGFDEFWRAERDRLYRVLAVGLGDAKLAAEAVDEAMARALQRWPKIRAYDDPAGWVFRVAHNWATSWRRKLSLRPTVPVDRLDRAVEDSVPDVDVGRVLDELPHEQRMMLALRFGLDWPIARIAGALDVPVGTVKSRLHRTLKALAERKEVLR